MNRESYSKTQYSVNDQENSVLTLSEPILNTNYFQLIKDNIVRMSWLLVYVIPFFFFSCQKQVLEPLNPYIYFANNIDYYVIDENAPITTDTIIRGSMSAERFLTQITMGDDNLNQDSIGALQTRYMINFPVTFSGSTQPYDVNFSCTDANKVTTTKPFHFIKSKPIDTYAVTLGAQVNSNFGFYFSFKDRKVHSISEFKELKDMEEGFCYGYNQAKDELLFLSPTELKNNGITDMKGSKVTSFCSIIAVNNQTFNKASFDNIYNDAFMMNLNGADYRTFAYINIGVDKFYLLKSESGLRGVVYVQNVNKGVAGSVDLVIKLQKQ
jgi:hypothetical protein